MKLHVQLEKKRFLFLNTKVTTMVLDTIKQSLDALYFHGNCCSGLKASNTGKEGRKSGVACKIENMQINSKAQNES